MNGNSYYEKYFRQTEDIDFEGATFLPIGGNYVREKGGATSFLAFSGYYNGHDHSISNVEVLQADGSYLPLDPSATYTIGTYDYTVTGGGFGGSLASCTVLSQSSTLYRDALVQYITTALGGTVGQQYAAPQGRITIVQ